MSVGASGLDALDGRIAGPSQAAKQRASRSVLGQPSRSPDIAVAVVGAAIADPKAVDHAVAEKGVILRSRVELRVWPIAVISAAQPVGNFAAYCQFEIRLGVHRRKVAAQV